MSDLAARAAIDCNVLIHATRDTKAMRAEDRAKASNQYMMEAARYAVGQMEEVVVSALVWAEFLRMATDAEVGRARSLARHLTIDEFDEDQAERAGTLLREHRQQPEVCSVCMRHADDTPCKVCKRSAPKSTIMNDALIVAHAEKTGLVGTLYAFDGWIVKLPEKRVFHSLPPLDLDIRRPPHPNGVLWEHRHLKDMESREEE